MKDGLFHRTKLLVWVERTLGASFTIVVADPRFRNVKTSLVEKKNSRGRPSSLWLVVTLGECENGHDDRETCTQGAPHPDEQFCSIEDPMFHCKV
ncbi:predicted protein [Lichtheimia corymbifera JMRC:FSU:9682]|uniref:Uncharacterized protein n=1 Tax=Lichtheimia corymbifera JMRC:FSU:9682 TaxID=1263082 RepID=A0A068RUI4_9FUNG|nr:predicted protein [Lichtheimia corymbifera JMRC:FSU:9682]